MLPLTKRQGSNLLQSGNSFYTLNQVDGGVASPLDAPMSPAYGEGSPSAMSNSGLYDFRVKTPYNGGYQQSSSIPSFHFKRFRSVDSFSTDVSPSSRSVVDLGSPYASGNIVTPSAKHPRTMTPLITPPATQDFLNRSTNGSTATRNEVPRKVVISRDQQRRVAMESDDDEMNFNSSADMSSVPILKLGDDGRAKLKSALSEQVRVDPRLKSEVDAIGKIRLASMQQLLQMAKICGLWDYALMLAKEHEMAKLIKRTG